MAANIQRCLEQMTQRLGLRLPAPEASGYRSLYFDGQRVEVATLEKGIRLQAEVGALPEESHAKGDKLKTFSRLSAGNLASLETSRETLTVDTESLKLLIFRELAVESDDVDILLDALSEFVNAVEFWLSASGSMDRAPLSGIRP